MCTTDPRPMHRWIFAGTLALSLGFASAGANATSEVFMQSNITGCCIVNAPGPAVSETFSDSTSASYAGFPSQSFSDGRSIGSSTIVPVDAMQATSGTGPFPTENDFSAIPGVASGMIGARADIVTGSVDPSGGAWNSVAEVRTTGQHAASATASAFESVTYDIPEGMSVRFFLTETDQFYWDNPLPRYWDARPSVQAHYTVVGPGANVVVSGAWDPISCVAICDSGPIGIRYDVLETGPLAAGRYTFDFEFDTAVSVFAVDEPQTALFMMAGLSLVIAARRRRPRGSIDIDSGLDVRPQGPSLTPP